MKLIQKIFLNLMLIAYPLIIFITLKINMTNVDLLMRNNIGTFQLVVSNSIYFIFLTTFIYTFFIKEYKYNIVALIIGLIISVMCQIHQIMFNISYNISFIIFSQIQLSFMLFGTAVLMYLILLLRLKQRSKSNI